MLLIWVLLKWDAFCVCLCVWFVLAVGTTVHLLCSCDAGVYSLLLFGSEEYAGQVLTLPGSYALGSYVRALWDGIY